MSYYTTVEFTFAEKPPKPAAVLDRARAYLVTQADKYPDVDFVLDQMRTALKKEKGDVKGFWSDDFEGLMTYVSAGFPGVVFYVRGVGEEFSDVWLRMFRDGEIVFRLGPFDDEVESALDEE